jgi:hypothetical protein
VTDWQVIEERAKPNHASWGHPASEQCAGLLELRARVEALEAGATCPHIRSSDEGTSYCALAEQTAAAQPNHLEKPNSSDPADSLVERVADAIYRNGTVDGFREEARAAIREVAAWMRENDCGYTAARWLEQEANR